MGHQIDGIINLNKPPATTSFQMVAMIRKLSGVRKTGHAGTLDPDATGVLPVLLGRATKLASFLTESGKVYQADIKFGCATTTYDSSGDVTIERDVSSLSLKEIEFVLDHFHGDIEQVPPMYSALKHQGKPLYIFARSGLEVERQPRKVHISRIEIIGWQKPILSIEVECSKGTYIRSIAHDMGETLGYGAHLAGLTRIRVGSFHIDQSITIEQLETGFQNDTWPDFIHTPDVALRNLGVITVNENVEQDISYGHPFRSDSISLATEGEFRRTYSEDGRFLALVKYDESSEMWKPKRVFI